ncbi:uncharacterized protein Tco025E_06025 [Trypanosoma conorhini]|uniref:Uncharacterized protein n=1 Tax=Trypanosoma conorhini TaxID=83891 RepID=A0A3R7N152_9TRYP|nr:uncharacterized protein Tco025E_06025 [Trypanosoma conorhini]RNF14292.1 hypothetical protein Tco025E_06025 [Trypanosoma conorhini]
MIHPYALLLSGLLTSSAALGGHLPAAVLLMYMMLLRNAKGATSSVVLLLAFLFALLQLLSTLIVNLVTAFSPGTWKVLFGDHRVLVESFGVYEAGPGAKAWIVAGACIPSGLTAAYIILFRRKLSRRVCLGHTRPLLTTMAWAFMSVVTALIAPTVLAGALLLIGMASFSCVSLGASTLVFGAVPSRHGRFSLLVLHVCSVCGTFASCIILVASCVAQNSAVAYVLGEVDPMYGLTKLYHQPVDIAVRRFVQLCLMMITLFLAQMAVECHGREVQQQNVREPLLREEASRNVPRVSEGVRSATPVAVVFNRVDNADAGAAPSPRQQRCSLAVDTPHGRSQTGRSSLCSNAVVGVSLIERVVLVFGHAGTWMLRKLLASSRLVPLALMAANMITFPTVVSLGLLPTMMLGQILHAQSFAALLRPTLLLAFFLVNAQYVVFATDTAQPDIVRRLFLSDKGRWLGLAQLIANETVFLAMLAAYVVIRHHARLVQLEENELGDDNDDDAAVPPAPRPRSLSPGLPSRTPRESATTSRGSENSNHCVNEEAPLDFLGVRRVAELKLGAQRVAELLTYLPSDPLEGSEAFAKLFASLVGRRPTAEEDRCLCKDGIGDALLLEKLHDSQRPLLSYYVLWTGVLLMRHAVLIALCLLFLVGSFAYHMDLLHAVVLLLFILYFLLPETTDNAWMLVVVYLMCLTSFELIFTFVSGFVTLPTYVAGTPLQYATIGLVPLRSRYEAVPYVLAVFVLTFLFLRLRVCRSWGTAVSLHEWDRFCRSNVARKWSRRATMTVATTVFVALGVFLHYSLIVEGFLALFLLLTISAAALALSNTLFRALWCVACVYGGVVVAVTSVCQFTQLAGVLREYVFQRLCPGDDGSSNANAVRHCEQEIGLYPAREDMPLTFFLAPWFLAFATAMTHFALDRESEAPPTRPEHDEEAGRGVDATQQQEEQPEDQTDGGQRFVHPDGASLPSLVSDDQRFIRHSLRLLAAMDTVGEWVAAFGADYGGVLGWVSLFLLATSRFTVIDSVYVVFFLLDFTHISVLVYCVLHILALYTYKFSFVAEITYSFRGVPLAAFIGLEKGGGDSPLELVLGPVLVFFVMLLCIHTRGANKDIRRRQRTEGPESSSWKSVLCTQLFFYAGYEGLVLTLLILLASSSDSCSGAVVGLLLLPLLLLTGRQRLYRASPSFFLLMLLLSLILVWQYALLLNAAHNVFPTIVNFAETNDASDTWRRWVFASHYHTLVGCFIGIMLLHTNRQQSADTAVSFSVLRSQFNGHTTLVGFVRAASVRSLQRLPRDSFDRVVPCFLETSPPSRLGSVTTLVVYAVSYLCPVAVFSFAAGVASPPSVVNLILLIAGLLQLGQMEMLRWCFFSLWPFIAAAYWLLICLPVVCNAPYVRQFLAEHRSFSEVVGVMQAGEPFLLGPLHVLLLFVVTVQTRVYNEFRYTKVLRHLYDRTSTRHSRHEELWAWLRAKYGAEQQLADAKSRALRAKLKEIRSTLCRVNGAWEPENIPLEKCTAEGVTGETELQNDEMTMMALRPRAANDDAEDSDAAVPRLQKDEGACSSKEMEKKEEKALTDEDIKDAHSMPDGGGARKRSLRTRLQRTIYASATRFANWLALRTYDPRRHTAARYRGLHTRLFWVALRALERHTVMVVLLVTMINFMLSRCLWELLPFCFILLVAITYHPFPPRSIFVCLFYYVAFGILLKELVEVVLAHVSYSPSLLEFLRWTILHVSEGAYWKQRIGYSYVMMDFVVFATLLLHQNTCLANGVYSQEGILRSRECENPPEAAQGVSGGNDPPAATGAAASLDFSPVSFADAASATEQLAGKQQQQQQQKGRQVASPPEASAGVGRTQGAMGVRQKVSLLVFGFVQNAVTTPGVGRDWYIYSLTVDAAALVVFVLGYNKLSGGAEDTLQESLRRNLLPGPMVIVVLVSILYMIADRMLYVTQCMKGKLLLNTMSGVAYCLCYLLWGNLVAVQSRIVGNLYFTLKIIALTIAVLQLRVGYPRHRRHDPFTCTAGRSWIMGCLYALYRGVPFLWEVRVVTDWTVEKTALSLDSYLKIEDLYDIVFERQCRIHEAREQQPVLGTPICRSAKLSIGLPRLALILLALMAPLVYYSTFNPAMESNAVTQLRVGLSFTSLQPFYASTTFTAEAIPKEWALWLARTRPSLGQGGIMNTKKTLQLVTLSSCSNDLWPISPQAFRRLNEQLAAAVSNKTTVQMYHSLELTRSGTANPVSYTQSWTVSSTTAQAIHYMLNHPIAHGTNSVLLHNFYTPFLFVHPDGFAAFGDGTGRNFMDCSIVLRQEVEPALNYTVRYWCVKCQSLFTGGNVPSANLTRFPEWDCLSTGEGCSSFDFELRNGDDGYNPVSMYFVILSDPSVGGVSFLQGIGIVALYTTFVLALGRIFRGMFADKAKHAVLTAMADPTPVAQLIAYIELARECGDLRLEQSVYFELVDLLRSPERLLHLTGFNRRLYDAETEVSQSPRPSASGAPAEETASRHDDTPRAPATGASTAGDGAHEKRE